MITLVASVALAQEPSCVRTIEDFFPDDGAVVPADVLPQIVFRSDCNIDRTQVELLDASGQVLDTLVRVETHHLEWDVVLLPGETYTIRLWDSEESVEPSRTFTLTEERTVTPEASASFSSAFSEAFDDEAKVQLVVTSSGDPNLRIHTTSPFQVHPVTEASTTIVHRTDPKPNGDACVDEVEVRAANGARIGLPGDYCGPVTERAYEEVEMPSGRCSVGATGPALQPVLDLLRRR